MSDWDDKDTITELTAKVANMEEKEKEQEMAKKKAEDQAKDNIWDCFIPPKDWITWLPDKQKRVFSCPP